ncbi:MAG: Mannose-6-phosphate isomerase, partial [Verrucomicrobiales bacterium]|nr:Mannose-6-phosphate isomerase [Verrucomicrobiales bacterium]
MLYPLIFEPIFKERIWGGRKLEQLYGKPLPPKAPFGESWEISDRPGDESVIATGPLKGKNLHWLVENHGTELFGKAVQGNFPLLIKILDAQEKLSLQVHPPAKLAPLLGGEPKTEMWYIAHAEPGAELYVGLKRGVTRAEFETKIKSGKVEDCFHRVPVKTGDAMFLPSGRVHAIGAGLVIFEVQQN